VGEARISVETMQILIVSEGTGGMSTVSGALPQETRAGNVQPGVTCQSEYLSISSTENKSRLQGVKDSGGLVWHDFQAASPGAVSHPSGA
jgi:hypothetical protein